LDIIRTVLGDIPASEIGVTDAHDHLIRSGGPEVMRDPGFLMDDLDAAKAELDAFVRAGGHTMVCMDPIGCGRNVPKMLELAEAFRGSANLVMTTGFHKSLNYCTRTSFLAELGISAITKLMIDEITLGMDLHSYNGPVVERGTAKAGVIKAGTSYRLITTLEEKALTVAALTQKETGCPLSVHTDNGTMGPEILQIIKQVGGDPEHTVLCHLQRNPDRYYYEMIADAGAFLCFDEPNKAAYRPDTEIAENILWLIRRGFGKQILVGMDGGRAEALAAYMQPKGKANGLDYLLTRFIPILKKMGASEDEVHSILIDNAAHAFSIRV